MKGNMKQVFNKSGNIIVEDVPAPTVRDEGVLVANAYSLISTGTELTAIKGSSGNIISKVIKNPKLVKEVIDKVNSIGIQNTIGLIKEKLEQADLLGYSSAGIVIEKGKNVTDIAIGDRVACGGLGYANHAEAIYVPRNLVAKIPEGVKLREAAFTTIGSIAMQGVRRARVEFGEIIVVIGLGLVGQLTSQILRVAGCRVIGIDIVKGRVELAKRLGMDKGVIIGEEDPVKEVMGYTQGIGADAVIICAATDSNEPVRQAMEMVRDKGRVVVVGAVGMDIERSNFYRKELDFISSRSYGPGRYDSLYEEKGIDYPLGYVRWTENRNMQEFLQMIAEKKVSVEPLIGYEFSIDDAQEAYRILMENKPLAVLLKYREDNDVKIERKKVVTSFKKIEKDKINIAVIGAGGFAKYMHLPNLSKISDYNIRAIVSATPINAKQVAKLYKAEYCTTDYKEVLEDDDIDMVLIATRHNLHAPITIEAAKAGKHVFVEKPLAMSYEELKEVEKAIKESGVNFMVGFNRRFSPLSIKAKELLKQRSGPMIINYRVNVGHVSRNHWMNDPVEGGGRIIGEACHMFDFFYYLTDAEIEEIFARSISSNNKEIIDENIIVAVLKFTDGSIASLTYTTLGSSEFPKERIEIFKGESVIVINDFREIILSGFKERGYKLRRQDKGHYNELVEFAKIVKGEKEASFGLEEGVRVTECTLKIVKKLRKIERGNSSNY